MVPPNIARLAQLVEQSVYTGKVRSSSLLSRTSTKISLHFCGGDFCSCTIESKLLCFRKDSKAGVM